MSDRNYIVPAGTYIEDVWDRRFSYPEDSFYYSDESKELTEIKIPDGIGIIAEDCFSCCSNLTSCDIPDSVHTIDSTAFYDCKKLKHIKWPENLTEIGNQAFEGCSLDDYNLPEALRVLGSDCFNKNLDLIKVPDSLQRCAYDAFGSYAKTVEVLLRNPAYKIINDCMVNVKNGALLFVSQKARTIIIPSEVTYISRLYFNVNVKRIVVPPELMEKFSRDIFSALRNINGYNAPVSVVSEFSQSAKENYEKRCSYDKSTTSSKGYADRIKYEIVESFGDYIKNLK